MNLEKLAREIALCKSPNVDSWLVPIADLEGMISMIQRQESELAKSHDEIEALKAAISDMQARMGGMIMDKAAPSVTVDSPHD